MGKCADDSAGTAGMEWRGRHGEAWQARAGHCPTLTGAARIDDHGPEGRGLNEYRIVTLEGNE